MLVAWLCVPALASDCPSSARVDIPDCARVGIYDSTPRHSADQTFRYFAQNTCEYRVRLRGDYDGAIKKANLDPGQMKTWNAPNQMSWSIDGKCCTDRAEEGAVYPKFCTKKAYKKWVKDWEVRIDNRTGDPVIARCTGNSSVYISNGRAKTIFCKDDRPGVVWMTAPNMPVTPSYWLENDCANNRYADLVLEAGEEWGDIVFTTDRCRHNKNRPEDT